MTPPACGHRRARGLPGRRDLEPPQERRVVPDLADSGRHRRHQRAASRYVSVRRDITEQCRSEDTIARLGGDEFTILPESIAHDTIITYVAEKVIGALSRPFAVNGHTLHIGTSVGISCCPDDGNDATTLFKHADAAMYQAKAVGRNDFQFYSHTMATQTSEWVVMEANLKPLSVDTLKIGRAFVRDIAEDESDMAIVCTILALARQLPLSTVAEGVEAEAPKSLSMPGRLRLVPGLAVRPSIAGRSGRADMAT